MEKKDYRHSLTYICLLFVLGWNVIFSVISYSENKSFFYFIPKNARQVNMEAVEELAATITKKDDTTEIESVIEVEAPPVDDTDTDVEVQQAVGVTEFIEYEPIYVDSPFYYDPGRVALTTDYPYETVEDDYFADSLWIGDSRVMGIHDYSPWKEAEYLADNGYCIYKWSKQKPVTMQSTGEKVLIEDAIEMGTYSKVYIMLGINDCGYATTEYFKEHYSRLVELIKEKQPGAIIYLCANLRESMDLSTSKEVENNVNINAKNVAIAELADGVTTFYLDFNPLFTDADGYLLDELTFDGAHMYASAYVTWEQFFREHAVIPK